MSFATSFRRVLYLTVLLDESCDYLNAEDDTDSGLASKVIDMQSAIKKLYKVLQKADPTSWAKIQKDLESDRFSHFGLLIDEISNVENIETIREAVREWMGEHAPQYHQAPKTINAQ